MPETLKINEIIFTKVLALFADFSKVELVEKLKNQKNRPKMRKSLVQLFTI